jgi:DNA mismatch repair ATPase MutL
MPISNDTLVALIDQHAADERYRLEAIVRNLSSTAREKNPSIELPFSPMQLQALAARKEKLRQWGIVMDISDKSATIIAVAEILMDVDATRWKSILLHYLLEDELDCPSELMNLFCSKACRSVRCRAKI